MKKSRLAVAMGYIDDDLVSGAVEYQRQPKKWYQVAWLKWSAIAACFVLIISTDILHNYFQPADMGGRFMHGDAVYQFVNYEIPSMYSIAPIYIATVEVDEAIREIVEENYHGIDSSIGLFVFSFEAEERSEPIYWFPVLENGRITKFVYASKTDDGRVVIGYSKSDRDLLMALSSLTRAETPMYLVSTANSLYCVIGDKAYATNPIENYEDGLPEISKDNLDIHTIVINLE